MFFVGHEWDWESMAHETEVRRGRGRGGLGS
jgi:hypothetical protein